MTFKKPFQAKTVVIGPYLRAEQERIRRQNRLRQLGMVFFLTLATFVIGMAVTNWPVVRAKLPTYYWNCAAARAAGAAPIHRGEPGFRSALDADDDGIACEPYVGRRNPHHFYPRLRGA